MAWENIYWKKSVLGIHRLIALGAFNSGSGSVFVSNDRPTKMKYSLFLFIYLFYVQHTINLFVHSNISTNTRALALFIVNQKNTTFSSANLQYWKQNLRENKQTIPEECSIQISIVSVLGILFAVNAHIKRRKYTKYRITSHLKALTLHRFFPIHILKKKM